jgi:amino acid transporter
LSIAIVLPSQYIHLAGGLMQVFAAFFNKFNLGAWVFVMSIMIVAGSLGSLINWILSPAKGLLNVSEYGYLPAYFSHLNKRGVASRILIAQAVIVSLLCMLFLLLPSVNAFYWFLMAISSSLYMVMYIMMFFAAIRLRPKLPAKAFHIPFGRFGLFATCGLGLLGAIITIIVGFIPPPGIPIASPLKYALMIACGNIVMICPVFLLFLLKRKKKIVH